MDKTHSNASNWPAALHGTAVNAAKATNLALQKQNSFKIYTLSA
jgi:hypothetical protein